MAAKGREQLGSVSLLLLRPSSSFALFSYLHTENADVGDGCTACAMDRDEAEGCLIDI
jgi:hypothetical protein